MAKKAQTYAVIKPATMQGLDKLAIAVRDGIGEPGANPVSEALGLAGAVVHLQQALTAEIMAPIMALQSKAIGFRTDKDVMKNRTTGKYEPGPGYPVEIVKDVFIEAMTHGARMIKNEVNIIAARCYLTKEYFSRKLTDELGEGNWEFIHGIPQPAAGGAVITTTIRFRRSVSEDWKEFPATFPIKGDGYSTADQYIGKADRKAGARLFSRVFGATVPDGDASEAIDVTPIEQPEKSPLEEAPEYEEPTGGNPDHAPADPRNEPAAEPIETAAAAPSADPVEEVTGEEPTAPRRNAAADRKVLAEVVSIAGANRVNEFLQSIGWIEQDKSFRDLSVEHIGQIVDGKDGFIAKCLGDTE